MRIVEDAVIDLQLLDFTIGHNTDPIEYLFLHHSHAAMQVRSMLQGVQELIFPENRCGLVVMRIGKIQQPRKKAK